MARFILLNGPPGIGKSTLARRFADDHHGTLNLDVDQLRTLIGGWRTQFIDTGQIVRPLALALAETHLRRGRDVIMPQYLVRAEEIERFSSTAAQVGAGFVEIVLMDRKHGALHRFTQRGNDAGDRLQPWHRYVTDYVRGQGGEAFLAQMYDDLTAAVHSRPNARTVFTTIGAIEQGYRDLLHTLATYDPA